MRILVAVLLSLVSFESMALDKPKVDYSTLQVIYSVAVKTGLDAADLVRIAYVESRFKVNAVRVNTNGTTDVGLFQVNSIHWTSTCKGLDVFSIQGNTECAARIILKHKKSASHFDTSWLGRYHSKTPSRKAKYINLLKNAPIYTISQK